MEFNPHSRPSFFKDLIPICPPLGEDGIDLAPGLGDACVKDGNNTQVASATVELLNPRSWAPHRPVARTLMLIQFQ
jgi:hypothetical protein